MRAAFFVSSIGDANLALDTIKALENSGHQIALISLTEEVDKHIKTFSSSALIHKSSINELISTPAGTSCNLTQLSEITTFIKSKDYQQVFIGVLSANNLEIPFQIAELLDDLPVLMAYEYMFKPEPHVLWSYFSKLKNKTNIQWALPLDEALKDFDTRSRKHIIGHLSIGNAFTSSPAAVKTQEEVLKALKIEESQKLSFVSGTTQPTEIDATFVDCLLEELKKHPSMQLRIGLHPGIKDFDSYIADILIVCKKYSSISSQFKIILPDILVDRFKKPELSINHSDYAAVFLKVNITGAEAASAATHVAQAVPGALLNEAALKGKPVCYRFGKAYLPPEYFSNSLGFFSATPRTARSRSELGLNDKTAAEACAQVLMDTQDEQRASVTRNMLAEISK